VLVLGGALLLSLGSSRDHGGESVLGILALVLGLVCVRILFWVRRARRLTRIALDLHVPDQPSGGSPQPPSGE
jgi:Flp pilus assembly protein TadB